MIYSFSHRIDGPAFYWDWFLARVDEGVAQVRNPYYPEKVSTYDLTRPACDGFSFTSKDYRPVIADEGHRSRLMKLVNEYPTMWAFTITPYRDDVEPYVPSNADAVETFKELSRLVGRERMTWMYAPIALQDGRYDLNYHIEAFRYLATELAPYCGRCSLDELRVYVKVSQNAPLLRAPYEWEMDVLLEAFSNIAGEVGLRLHACPAHHDWAGHGVDMSPCMSLERFAEVNGVMAKSLRFKSGSGIYNECPDGCMAVRDLAPYGTCPHGCRYCYANPCLEGDGRAKPADARSALLLDELLPSDVVSSAKPRVYLKG